MQSFKDYTLENVAYHLYVFLKAHVGYDAAQTKDSYQFEQPKQLQCSRVVLVRKDQLSALANMKVDTSAIESNGIVASRSIQNLPSFELILESIRR